MKVIRKMARFFLLLSMLFIIYSCNAQKGSLPFIDTLLKKTDYQEVFRQLDSIEKTSTPKSCITYYRALCDYRMKEYNQGIRLCSGFIDNYTTHDSTLRYFYVLYVSILQSNRDYEAALTANSRLMQLAPDSANYYVNQSVLYGFTGQIRKSLKVLDDGRKIDPGNYYIYNNLSYYNGHYRHYVKAVKYATMGLKLQQDSDSKGYLYNNRGYAELKLHQLKKANKDIDLAMVWNSTNCFAYYYKALAILSTKNYFDVCKYVQLSESYGGKNLVSELSRKYCH